MDIGFYSLGYVLSTFHVWRDHTIAQPIIDALADEENQ